MASIVEILDRPSEHKFNNIWYFLQEFIGEDDSDLYLEEREESLKQAQAEKRRIQMSVPGILNPHEIPEEMQD